MNYNELLKELDKTKAELKIYKDLFSKLPPQQQRYLFIPPFKTNKLTHSIKRYVSLPEVILIPKITLLPVPLKRYTSLPIIKQR